MTFRWNVRRAIKYCRKAWGWLGALVLGAILPGIVGQIGMSGVYAAQPQYRLTIEDPDPHPGDDFGAAIAFAGGDLWIGAPGNDRLGAGTLYLFDAQTGALRMRVDSPGGVDERFGATLAIVGDFVIAGAPNAASGAGAAYVFNRFTGEEVRTVSNPGVLSPSYDFAGRMTAVGDRLAFGNWIGENGVYLFDSAGNQLLHTIRNPDAGQTGWFGQTMGALGDELLVGAPTHQGPRAVYAFDAVTAELRLRIDDPDPNAEASFGRSVAGAGGKIVVGSDFYDPAGTFNAGAIFVFDGSDGQLLRTIEPPDLQPRASFGSRLAAYGDDLLVSAPGVTSAGIETGSVYWIDPGTGATRLRLVAPRTESSSFGQSLAVSADVFAIGAPQARAGTTSDAGAVHLFLASPAPLPLETTLVAADAEWKYLDDGSEQGTAWREAAFDDGAWSRGSGPFGYGNGDETTVVDCGLTGPTCDGPVHVTTYFRREFAVADPEAIIGLGLHMAFDDGVIAYLNGVEVFRGYLPADVNSSTSATYPVEEYDGGEETQRHPLGIDPALLVAGNNVLAVEIHQFMGSYDDDDFTAYVGPFDLRFDARLETLVAVPEPSGANLLVALLVFALVGGWHSRLGNAVFGNALAPQG